MFGKQSPNEIVAIVRVPELTYNKNVKTNTLSRLRYGASEPELNKESKQDEHSRLHYQRVHASSYLPPLMDRNYRQRQSRSGIGTWQGNKRKKTKKKKGKRKRKRSYFC